MNLQTFLPKLATSLIKVSNDHERRRLLRQQLPRFFSHLQRLAKERPTLARWGRSINIDELAGLTIVDPMVLSMIGSLTNTAMNSPGFHAGLQHTYGYLLSLVETPYGFKRDRWITSTIEDGFGLPSKSLQAFPNRGTLLVNLTSFLSRISLSEQPKLKVHGSVANFDRVDLSAIRGWRIVEQIEPKISNHMQSIEIRTDILPFLNATLEYECLLVYSLRLEHRPSKLITTFPISSEVTQALLHSSRFGDNQPIRLRYNAYCSGLTEANLVGKRTCAPLPPITSRI